LFYLRDEEEEEGLREMAEDGHNSESHAREVAEGVTGKDLGTTKLVHIFMPYSYLPVDGPGQRLLTIGT
jgi:hypothetical protein